MRVSSGWLAWACLVSASSSYAQSSTSPDSSAAVFRRLIADRTAARSSADTAGYRRLADPALVYLEDDGTRQTLDQHIHLIAKAGREPTRIRRGVIDSLHVHFEGGLALVDYWLVLRVRYGSQDVESPYRLLDVFVHRGDQWLLLRHAETHAVASPPAIALAPAALDDYVGRYEWWPGYIETFTRRGNQLFYQGTGDTTVTLLRAATRESFFTDGDPGVNVFVRDKSGRVIGCLVTWPDGQVTPARRLR